MSLDNRITGIISFLDIEKVRRKTITYCYDTSDTKITIIEKEQNTGATNSILRQITIEEMKGILEKEKIDIKSSKLEVILGRAVNEVSYLGIPIENGQCRVSQKPYKPPSSAMKFMFFFIAKSNREALIGDVLEDYPEQVENLESVRLANLWVWKECTFIVGNAFLDWFIRKYEAIKGLIKLGGGS